MNYQELFSVHHHDGNVIEIRFITPELSDLMIHDSLSQAFTELIEQEELKKVVVNLERVEYCTSGVIGSLLSLKKAVQANGGEIRMSGVYGNVLESFESLNLIGAVFQVDESVNQAIGNF